MTDFATKYDDGKPQMSLISAELIERLAHVRMFGLKKYARDNWKKGFKYSRSIDASLRHIFAMLKGELTDFESGELHAAHAVACLEHLIYDILHHPENDDLNLQPKGDPHGCDAGTIYIPENIIQSYLGAIRSD